MEEKQDTEQLIINTAKRLFIEKGFDETSMSDVARKVGLNRPALHYYFRTKDKLFEAVFSIILNAFVPKLREIIMQPAPVSQRIEKIVNLYFGVLRQNPCLPLFLVREMQRKPDHLVSTVQHLDTSGYIDILKQTMLKEMDEGHMKKIPLEHVFYSFYGLMAIPFLTQSFVEVYTGKKIDEVQLDLWRQHVIDNLCNLLCTDKDAERTENNKKEQ